MAQGETVSDPCEQPDNPIALIDAFENLVEQCSDEKINHTKRIRSNDIGNETIPCEFCNGLVNISDWEPHIEQCANVHKRRLEKLRNGFDDQPINADIPCEYCDVLINAHDLEWHTSQCRQKLSFQNDMASSNADVSIPCEYCQKTINMHELEFHTRQCAQTWKYEVNAMSKEDTIFIPCEYCQLQIESQKYELHTRDCANASFKQNNYQIRDDLSNERIPCEYCHKLCSLGRIEFHQNKCANRQMRSNIQSSSAARATFDNKDFQQRLLKPTQSPSVVRITLDPSQEEYKFVESKFHETLPICEIVNIEQIQNRRWFRQYEAHKEDFIERYGISTEQWLFHGCRESRSVDAIINDCFNRSHVVHCVLGQGIYFATKAVISHNYTTPDAKKQRYMFMARVLVGRTTGGNSSTRVCPQGFDTTGGGDVFVTYHDAQAYAEYLIVYK